eukprot:CAMPEP_0198726142 /NCGR_PEP_ID=MMETSP1475-20131203/3297_1 /TAXON_ID= ORGANISM="Unidentified sp., Strain CCMP1999" /NCGR_SAMPLE_ID=MMETSP1475 /ASSEMBLY_ACC=CAM_ASM_001111 /LENGTH=504 /DNA_ID=CAMNT_0044488039 /DNA_START=68 /DNA_END=1582 /DNA_ORIENTATION=-
MTAAAAAVGRGERVATCLRTGEAVLGRRCRTRMNLESGQEESRQQTKLADGEVAFSSAVSTKKRLSEALADAVDEAMFNLPVGCVPDLAIVYASASYEDRKVGLNRERLDYVVPQLRELVPGLRNVIGGTVAGVVGADIDGRCTEIEDRPAVSVTLARIPNAQINVFHVDERDLPSLDGPPDNWVSLVGGAKPKDLPSFIMLCNSAFYSSGAMERFAMGVDFAYPGSVKVGGVVGAPSPTPGLVYGSLKKDLLTLTSRSTYENGIVGVTISGGISMETIVTQGVRGVGPVFTVRKVTKKSLVEVEAPGKQGSPPTILAADRALKFVISNASKDDQAQLFKNPLLGVADDEFKDDLRDGDYLCRKVQGIDPRTGGMAMADHLRPGQRVRFHVRDAEAAINELDTILNRFKRSELQKTIEGTLKPILGTLAFMDVTRGMKFFREPNIDSTTFVRYFPASLVGFFAQAEFSPFGAKRTPTQVHESTAVFAIVRSAADLEQKPASEEN